MADGHHGSRPTSLPPVTKIFTAFRIALDLKKMALAGAGIFATSLGWWGLCWLFYTPVIPQWKDYDGNDRFTNVQEAWKTFQRDRGRWNFLHRVAGPPTNDPRRAVRVDAGDIARSPEQYKELEAVLSGQARRVTLDVENGKLLLDSTPFAFTVDEKVTVDILKKIEPTPLIDVVLGDEKSQIVTIAGQPFKIEEFEKFRGLRDGIKPLAKLSVEDRELFIKKLEIPILKPAGVFRTCPWNEDRGPNPYLLTMDLFEGKAVTRGGFFAWLFHDQLPVLAEPIIKFISPVFYLFQRDAGGPRNTFFLAFVIIWNLAVWGYVGGAICRLAAVQFARNEKIPMGEVVAFVNPRYKHFALAPAFPLLGLLVFAIALAVFGFVAGWTHFFGDIVIAGLLWPVVLAIGLIMAVLLVGLFGWPLMYPTIAVEGSDAFDALSRSYSYVYQKPWHYLGYAVTALSYGAAVVFFVGFMGSLTVYLGQWGFNKGPWLGSEDPTKDRTPAYFFQHAPTSFGWRDLFLHDSPWAKAVEAPAAGIGTSPVQFELTEPYRNAISWNNQVGAWMVTFWLGLTFLLVVGFGYSYFWTASTILYFLMRKLVDDTEFDEIHLDEDDIPPPPPPSSMPIKAPEPAVKPGTVSLHVVDPPKPEPPGGA